MRRFVTITQDMLAQFTVRARIQAGSRELGVVSKTTAENEVASSNRYSNEAAISCRRIETCRISLPTCRP
jgi:hypothetical protein